MAASCGGSIELAEASPEQRGHPVGEREQREKEHQKREAGDKQLMHAGQSSSTSTFLLRVRYAQWASRTIPRTAWGRQTSVLRCGGRGLSEAGRGAWKGAS